MASLFSTDTFKALGQCYFWNPAMLLLQGGSNIIVGFSFIAIAVTLAYILLRIQKIPFSKMYWAFAVLIMIAGVCQLAGVLTIWAPYYWFEGALRAVEALLALSTAIVLPRYIGRSIALTEGAKAAQDQSQKVEAAYKELGVVFEKVKELDHIKTQFFVNVSHELRTTLTLIMGPTNQLLNATNLTVKQKQGLEIANRNVYILLKHVNDLLDIIKLNANRIFPHYAEVDLAQLIRSIVDSFKCLAEERKMNLSVEAPTCVVGYFDPDMVQRMILNMLANAFKFTPVQGGKIRVALSVEANEVVIEVQDNGIGVPESARTKIFQRFWQVQGGDNREYSGTGLGLSITKEFVDLHHGHISVEEAPGGGALFKIRMPLQAPQGTPIESKAYKETNKELLYLALNELKKVSQTEDPEILHFLNKKRSTVLVVDDNEEINSFVASVLSDDYDVITAFNGQEGLQKATLYKPDLVLTDIMMPKMSGHQMIQQIRKDPSLATICIVVLTAKADDQLRVQLLNEGVQDYVIKPFYPEEILARVKNLISMKKTRESLQSDLETQVRDIEVLAQEISTRRKELQNAVQARDEFLSIASHELKTPLTSLKLQLQVARRGMKKGLNEESIGETLSTSLKQVDSLASLVDELLDVTRIQSGKLSLTCEYMDLSSLVKEVVSHFSEQLKAARCDVELDLGELCTGKWDQSRLEQVLVNLISNAIKYAPGSHLKVSTQNMDAHVVLIVQDNGPGIEKEKQERLFERFERASSSRHVSGLGLGLFIAKNLIEAHDGTIKLISDVGVGTQFVIELPTHVQQKAI